MTASSPLVIRIRYLLVGRPDWHERVLTEAQYFDDDDEGYALDSVPRFDHADEYLDIGKDRLRRTELRIHDARTNATFSVTETFWSDGDNRIIEVEDSRDQHWEMIVSLREGGSQEIIRYGDAAGARQLIFHVTYQDDFETSHYSLLQERQRSGGA